MPFIVCVLGINLQALGPACLYSDVRSGSLLSMLHMLSSINDQFNDIVSSTVQKLCKNFTIANCQFNPETSMRVDMFCLRHGAGRPNLQ
jgi:hypothetical protein